MARRMIDPQAIIKSQIVDDKYLVDLNEILEKYGTLNVDSDYKSVTLQFYSKANADDSGMQIIIDDINANTGYIIENSAITITKNDDDVVYISGSIVDNLSDMNLLRFIEISDGEYENGIILSSSYLFDVHVIKV